MHSPANVPGDGRPGCDGVSGVVAGDVVAAGVRWLGRVDLASPQQPRFGWSGSGFVTRFSGTALTMRISGGAYRFKTVVDGAPRPTFTTTDGESDVVLATGLTAGEHTVALYRQTEGSLGDSTLLGLTVGDGALLTPPAGPGRLLEVIGDSISAGYGLLGTPADVDCLATESHWDTYGAVTARALGADLSTIAASGRGVYRNYDGDTAGTMPALYDLITPAGAARWDFRVAPQAVVINLGTNDLNNDKGDPGMLFRDAYRGLVAQVRSRYPRAHIICLIGPLLSGRELVAVQGHIMAVVDACHAAGDAGVAYFGAIQPQASENAACAYHPNAAQNQLMADQLTAALRATLGW